MQDGSGKNSEAPEMGIQLGKDGTVLVEKLAPEAQTL